MIVADFPLFIIIAYVLLVFSVATLGWMVLRYRSLDMMPVSRSILLDSIGDMVFVTDRHGKLVDMNAAALRQTGGSIMTWVGQDLARLPSPWNDMLDSCPGVRDAGVDGVHCWFDYACREIRDGKGRGIAWLHIIRDITQQHRAEAALRDSEEQLRLILDSIAEAVIVHDFQGRIVTVNSSMLKMYGLQTEQHARKYGILKELSDADNEFQIVRQSWKAILTGESKTIYRWKARRPLTGETFDVRVVLQLVSVGNVPLILATVFDVSDEIALQKREQSYQKLLEEQRFVDHQQQLIRDLHDGVGGIMAGIAMISELGVREPDAGKHAAMFRKIADLANEGNVEVRSLMNTLDSREFMWPDLIVELRRHGTMVEENHGIRFKLTVEGEGDSQGPGLLAGMSLFRIVKEALNNTLKHAGATQTVTELHFEPGQLRMVIADNGCGQQKINSSGRGLRNMRERIEALGGNMVLVSENGLRLEFRMPIPLSGVVSKVL